MGRVSFPQAKPQTQLVPLNSLLFSLSGFLVVFLPLIPQSPQPAVNWPASQVG